MLIKIKLRLILIPGSRVTRNNQEGRIFENAEMPVKVEEIRVNRYILHRT